MMRLMRSQHWRLQASVVALCLALILISFAMLMPGLVPGFLGSSVRRPVTAIKAVPIYPAAANITWSDSSQPGFVAPPAGGPGYDEAASLQLRTPDDRSAVMGFYDTWLHDDGWQPWA